MQFYEIECLIENMWMKDKTSWEQTRTVSYITAQCQSSKKLNPEDLMKFPWDKDYEKEDFSEEDRKAILNEMKEMEKKLNKK